MATASLIKNILGAESAVKAASSASLRPFAYTRRSSGTRDLTLSEPISEETGYWMSPASITSKPPRWIVHIDATGETPVARLAQDSSDQRMPGAGTPGYINNGSGKCALAAFRLMPAVKFGSTEFKFPSEWEWIVQFAFAKALPVGTSGDTLTDFNVGNSQLGYRGRETDKSMYVISHISLVKTSAEPAPLALPSGRLLTYDDATSVLARWLRAGSATVGVYNPASSEDMLRLQFDLGAVFQTEADAVIAPAETLRVRPAPELVGVPDVVYRLINAALAAGKRHFVFHGPPGTGKTTLAEYVAEQIAGDALSEGEAPYTLLTASSSWSSQDLVGGYQPLGPGRMGFVPGAMLRDFHKPIIIDELNRCPIDKVIGPLFSVLSGQSTTLPYRTAVEDATSQNYRILPKPNPSKASHEFAPGPAWAMLCTLNQVDKSQLEQISFALSRRFTWIRIGIPDDPSAFVRAMLEKLGLLKGDAGTALSNPVAELWSIVNRHRELGGAPVIDFLKLAAAMDPEIDFLAEPTANVQETFVVVMASTFLPLLDGISRAEAMDCSSAIASAWGLSGILTADVEQRFMELAP